MVRALRTGFILLLSVITSAMAHLDPGSLSIGGDGTFTAGEEVTISWKMAHGHDISHLIYLKTDDQSDWELIDSVAGGGWGTLDYSYSLVMPEINSEHVQVRIFLPEFSTTPSDNTDEFTLISEPFSIVPSPTEVLRHTLPGCGKTGLISRSSDGVLFDLKGRLRRSSQKPAPIGHAVVKKHVFIGTLR